MFWPRRCKTVPPRCFPHSLLDCRRGGRWRSSSPIARRRCLCYGSVWQRALLGAQACGTGPRGEADCGAVRAAVREEQQDCCQSPTKPSGPASTNRSRHRAIVLGLIADSWLIVRLDWPAAAARTIRQRNATCCGVPCAVTHAFSRLRSTSERLTAGHVPGMSRHNRIQIITPATCWTLRSRRLRAADRDRPAPPRIRS